MGFWIAMGALCPLTFAAICLALREYEKIDREIDDRIEAELDRDL